MYTLTPGGSTATVSMTVTCVDDAPVAVNDTQTVAQDSGANAVDVLANDTDVDGGPKSVASVTQPAHGDGRDHRRRHRRELHAERELLQLGRCPTPDTFTYTLNRAAPPRRSSVTVTCLDDPPAAVNDARPSARTRAPTAVDVLANDTDLDGGPKSIASVTQPANGTVVITGGGTGLTYAPNANYCNSPPGTTPDTFTYTLTPGGSTATVSVTVTCVDDPPVAVADARDGRRGLAARTPSTCSPTTRTSTAARSRSRR